MTSGRQTAGSLPPGWSKCPARSVRSGQPTAGRSSAVSLPLHVRSSKVSLPLYVHSGLPTATWPQRSLTAAQHTSGLPTAAAKSGLPTAAQDTSGLPTAAAKSGLPTAVQDTSGPPTAVGNSPCSFFGSGRPARRFARPWGASLGADSWDGQLLLVPKIPGMPAPSDPRGRPGGTGGRDGWGSLKN